MSISTASSEERTGAMITYLLTAFLGVIGALIGWAIFKGKGPFAKNQTVEALNWGITAMIVHIGLVVLSTILTLVVKPNILFSLLLLVVPLLNLVFGIIGAVKSNAGNAYRYPFALRLIK